MLGLLLLDLDRNNELNNDIDLHKTHDMEEEDQGEDHCTLTIHDNEQSTNTYNRKQRSNIRKKNRRLAKKKDNKVTEKKKKKTKCF